MTNYLYLSGRAQEEVRPRMHRRRQPLRPLHGHHQEGRGWGDFQDEIIESLSGDWGDTFIDGACVKVNQSHGPDLKSVTFPFDQIPGLTDNTIPRRLGPKRASKIRFVCMICLWISGCVDYGPLVIQDMCNCDLLGSCLTWPRKMTSASTLSRGPFPLRWRF